MRRAEGEGAVGSRTPQSATADGGGMRFFCSRSGCTPNPKPFLTSPAVSSRRDSERLGGAVEENQRNIQQPPGAQRCRCALFRRSVTLSLRNTLAVAQDSKKPHNTRTHPRRIVHQRSEAGRRSTRGSMRLEVKARPKGVRSSRIRPKENTSSSSLHITRLPATLSRRA